WRAVVVGATTAAMLVSPWTAWMATVGPEGRTQVALLVHGDGTERERIARQLLFYVQRIPDQITGPFVEVGTVFQRSPVIAVAASGWGVAAPVVIVAGWGLMGRRRRRRLAGMIAVCTLLLLLAWPYTEAGRFLIPLIPCILLGALEGLTGLHRRLDRPGWLG